jgi:hypothetical protein
MLQRIDPETFFTRPDVYPVEFENDQVNLVPMTRETYRRSIFTDRGRIVPAGPRGWQVPIARLLTEFESRDCAQQTIFFVFHIAHCGSTLLARALDLAERTLVIREPFTLRQLAADAVAEGGPVDPAAWKRCLRMTSALLGRRYAQDQTTIVKTNVPVNFILDPLLALNPDSAGVALYTGFEHYLLSVLKTPMHRRWVMNVSDQLAGGIRATAGLDNVDVGTLDPPRAAACLWLAQVTRLRAAVAAHERLRSLDCRELFDRPADVLRAAANLAGIVLSGPETDAIAGGELFRRHAKDPGREFDREARDRELLELATRLGPEVDSARAWMIGTGAWDGVDLPMAPALL